MTHSRPLALTAALTANLIYGLNYVIAKGIMPDYLQPRAIILIRVAGAALFFWLVSVKVPAGKTERTDLLRIAVASIFGVALNQIMFFEGLNLSTPINVSIIMVGVPITVLIFSRLLRGERLHWIKVAGIAIGTVGSALLILRGGRFDASGDTMLGNLLIVINASSYGLYLVLIKPLLMRYSALNIMRWVFLFGLLWVLPFTLPVAIASDWQAIPAHIWLSIGYVLFFTTVAAYFLNNYSLRRISPATNSSFIYLQPFFAGLVAILFGKDRLEWYMSIPTLLIFAGVYLVTFTDRLKSIIKSL
ncbi:MAG: DMT family transporter [Bacteroidetes bacterium]|nr:DMT family transporter [Bacteroidota bacterium]